MWNSFVQNRSYGPGMTRVQAEEALPSVFGTPQVHTVALGDNGMVLTKQSPGPNFFEKYHAQGVQMPNFYERHLKKTHIDKNGLSKNLSCFHLLILWHIWMNYLRFHGWYCFKCFHFVNQKRRGIRRNIGTEAQQVGRIPVLLTALINNQIECISFINLRLSQWVSQIFIHPNQFLQLIPGTCFASWSVYPKTFFELHLTTPKQEFKHGWCNFTSLIFHLGRELIIHVSNVS